MGRWSWNTQEVPRSVSSEINVMPPVRQISRVQTGLFRRAGAPTGSG